MFCGCGYRHVPGRLGIVLNLVSLFANGIGVSTSFCLTVTWSVTVTLLGQVDMVLSPGGAYQVDVLHSKSAEIMAASRSVIPPHLSNEGTHYKLSTVGCERYFYL